MLDTTNDVSPTAAPDHRTRQRIPVIGSLVEPVQATRVLFSAPISWTHLDADSPKDFIVGVTCRSDAGLLLRSVVLIDDSDWSVCRVLEGAALTALDERELSDDLRCWAENGFSGARFMDLVLAEVA